MSLSYDEVMSLPEEDARHLMSMLGQRFGVMAQMTFNEGRARYPALLAQIPIDGSSLFKWRSHKRLDSYMKQRARLLLDNPKADWSARTTTKGIRVTRVR